MSKIEIWKDVVGYEDRYQVSNIGRIKRKPVTIERVIGGGIHFPEKIMTDKKRGNGYFFVRIRKNKVAKMQLIHRLVATAFIPNPENKSFVNHINNKRSDNRLENLEWCTHSENMIHMFNGGYKNTRRKLTNKMACDILLKHKQGVSGALLARQNNISTSAISNLIHGKTYKKITTYE